MHSHTLSLAHSLYTYSFIHYQYKNTVVQLTDSVEDELSLVAEIRAYWQVSRLTLMKVGLQLLTIVFGLNRSLLSAILILCDRHSIPSC